MQNQMFNDFGGSLVQRAMNGNNVTIMTMGAVSQASSFLKRKSLFPNVEFSYVNIRISYNYFLY